MDLIERLYTLLEMSFPRAKVIGIIEGYAWEFIRHEIKLFLWSDDSSVNHWIAEIYGMCERVATLRLKKTNKPPSYDLIEQCLISGYAGNQDEFENILTATVDKCVNVDNYPEPHDYDIDDVYEKFCKLNNKLITEMSSGIVNFSKIKAICLEAINTLKD